MKEELVLRQGLVTLMVVKEIIITYYMASHRVTQRMREWCLHGSGHSDYEQNQIFDPCRVFFHIYGLKKLVIDELFSSLGEMYVEKNLQKFWL